MPPNCAKENFEVTELHTTFIKLKFEPKINKGIAKL